jgi:hypothetical protein
MGQLSNTEATVQAPVFVPVLSLAWFSSSVQVFPTVTIPPSVYSQPVTFILLQLQRLVKWVRRVRFSTVKRTDYLKRLVAQQPPSRAGPYLPFLSPGCSCLTPLPVEAGYIIVVEV